MITTVPQDASSQALNPGRRALALVGLGILILATGGLMAFWTPTEVPLGLLGLAAGSLLLLWPPAQPPHHGDPATDPADPLHSLVLASLLTLAGLHLLG